MSYFLSKVRFEKMLENGMQKTVTEQYLFNALSFTEAEARTVEELTPFITGEFKVQDISRTNYAEIFRDESGDKWYKVKCNFITLDERSGIEKKQANYYLVQASDIDNAKTNFATMMKGTLADYEVEAVIETKIMDVYDVLL